MNQIKKKIDDPAKASSEIFSKLYENAKSEGSESDKNEKSADDNVKDAEFETTEEENQFCLIDKFDL